MRRGALPKLGEAMNDAKRLARDHHLIRAKLDELEAALKQEHGWWPTRRACVSLLPVLQEHLRREAGVVTSCRCGCTPQEAEELSKAGRQHPDQPQLVGDLAWLACTCGYGGMPELTPRLLESIAQLRKNMEEEEAALFPALRRILARRSAYDSARLIFRSSWWE